MMLVGVVIIVLGFSNILTILQLALLSVLLLVPIFFGFLSWIQTADLSESAVA